MKLVLVVVAQLLAATTVQGQPRAFAIHDIQGPGARSPLAGEVVTTTGIVTGRKANGFFLQMPDDAADADPRTSEGIFVFTTTAPAANLTPGTLAAVTGRVIEFVSAADPGSPPLTELSELQSIEVRGAGARLPAPIEIRSDNLAPGGAHDQLERLEGMRVRIASLTMVSPTLGSVTESSASGSSNGVFYGVITGTPRPFREPGIDVREALPAGAPCCVPRFDGNPERIRVDSDGQPGAAALNVATGTIIDNLIGPLDYGFQSYTVLPDPSSPPTVIAAAAFDRVRAPTPDEFAVASFNLQRLFDATDDPAIREPVLTAAAFQRRLTKASLYMRRLLHLPVIIGVQEVENLATLQALAATLNRDAREARELKPRYEAYLDEGNDPGGIDVGFLVDRARVDVLQVTQEGRAELYRNPINGRSELLNDRPPLVLTARVLRVNGPGATLTVVVNHLRSLVDIDHPVDGARIRAKRAGQAEFLAALVDRRLRDHPSEPIAVLGDLNAFEFNDGYVDVTGTVRGAPSAREQVVTPTRDALDPDLVNLINVGPVDQRYSYVFEGNAQTLDHILVSDSLLARVTAFVHVRGNADSPEIWRSDGARPERISDHDPALIYIAFR
ncbi:MAG TPA: endonuclease/exonuclease/phosphatase family protein [Vicinamibacterales bacterium]|nr:endonuclease/exonuclease/phosphatase family protein [Vicinamibacterales bacterium]